MTARCPLLFTVISMPLHGLSPAAGELASTLWAATGPDRHRATTGAQAEPVR